MAAGSVGVAPGTTTFTLPDGRTVAIEDWIDDKIYNTVQLVNGQTSSIDAFTQGRGQSIAGGTRTNTRVDTNQPRSGDTGLPMSWEMFVYGIGIKVVRVMRPATGQTQPALADGSGALSDPCTLRTMFNIDRVTYLEFWFNEKVYTRGVLQDYPQGHGFNVFSTNANFELSQNGVPSPRDRNAMVLPIWLRENLGYRMAFQPEASLVINQAASDGSTNLTFADVKVYLYGLLRRNVS
jgi:hypothetical protein